MTSPPPFDLGACLSPGHEPRWFGSCGQCAGRIDVQGDRLCTACLVKHVARQEELRRLENLHKRITFESVTDKWFAGEEPER